MELYFRSLGYLRPHWGLVLIVFLCLLISSGLGLLSPVVTRQIVDKILVPSVATKPPENWARLLILYGLLLFLVHTASYFGRFFRRYLGEVVAQSVMHDFRNEVYGSLRSLPDSFFDSRGAGDIMSRNMADTAGLHGVIHALLDSTFNILSMLGMAVVLFAVSWEMAAISLVAMLLLVPVVFLLGKSIRRNKLLARHARGILNHFVFVKLSPADVNGAMAITGNAEEGIFDEKSDTYKQHNIVVGKLFAAVYAAAGLAFAAIGCVLWIYGGSEVVGGALTIGTLTLTQGYVQRFGGAVEGLSYDYAWIQRISAPAERVFEVLDTAAEG